MLRLVSSLAVLFCLLALPGSEVVAQTEATGYPGSTFPPLAPPANAASTIGDILPTTAPQVGLPSPPANPEPAGQQPRVLEVNIIGNETVSTDKIYALIRTRKDRTFDPQILQQDKRSLLTKGQFRDVRIATQQTAHGVIVTFEVFELPTIHYIKLLGDRGIGEKALLKEAGLKQGDALNFYAVEEARRKVEDLYHRKGYAKAQVTVAEGNRPEDRGVVLVIAEGPLQRIKAVEFTGNSSIASDSRLATQIESKPGILGYFFRGKLEHNKIASDIEKLTLYYRNMGFFGARISRWLEFDNDNQWVTIHFVIDEGPRYVVRNVSVIGNEKFPNTDLMSPLMLRGGDYFRQEYLDTDLAQLRDMYGGQGYIFADVKAGLRFHEEPGELDLVYEIAEGEQFRVGKINVRIAGEFPHTKERVILDRLSIRPGDIVDIREIRNSERRLKASQLFVVNPAEGEPPQIVIVPPDLKDAQEVLAGNRRGTFRGQDPNDDRPVVNLHVNLPRSWFFWP